MSSPTQNNDAEVVTSVRELTEYLVQGARSPDEWRIGTEHEKFGFRDEDLRAPEFAGERGIGALLEGIAQRFDWERSYDGANLIALKRPDGSSITLEPAGQLELSGAQLSSLHETCCEVEGHLREVRSVAEHMSLSFLGMGFQPKWRREDMPWMPKGRYRLMRAYMPKRGSLGLDMMTRTCTVQVNLDVSDEADMVKKFRVSLALQAVATALFADSPFTEGKPNGFQSYRSHIWTDTDPDRTGLLDFVFEPSFGYQRYVDYMLNVPMYFAYRNGKYLDATGLNFRDFLDGKLPILPGERPSLVDWSDHLTTAFPEVRLKRYLEMRGADSGPWGRICALPALWVGLLYDNVALDAAWDLCKEWTPIERHALRDAVPRTGLHTVFRGRTVKALAEQMVAISADGLRRRGLLNSNGVDERIYLDPLIESLSAGMSPADRKLALFHGRWKGSVDPVFREFAY